MTSAAAEADGSVVTFDLARLPTLQRMCFMQVVTRHFSQETGRLAFDLRDIPEGTVKEEMKDWQWEDFALLKCWKAAVAWERRRVRQLKPREPCCR